MEMAEVTWYWQQTVTKTQEDDLVQVRISVAVDAEYQQMVTDVVSFFGKPSTSGGR
jgi:general secretion pathway protein I